MNIFQKLKKIIYRLALFFKYHILFKDDHPSPDGSDMSHYCSRYFYRYPFLEQNHDTSLKNVLELLEKETYNTTYFGIPTIKLPLDFWVYQEIIFKLKPDIIIEIGNYKGGHILALAHILDNIGKGKIIGIDIDQKSIPSIVKKHPRIKLIEGDACESFNKVKSLCKPKQIIMIIEDSSHSYDNTLNILRKYSSLVSLNSYFIVEDSICHHGLDIGPNPGPYEAIIDFIRENHQFIIDRSKEKFLITWNIKGYLKRKK